MSNLFGFSSLPFIRVSVATIVFVIDNAAVVVVWSNRRMSNHVLFFSLFFVVSHSIVYNAHSTRIPPNYQHFATFSYLIFKYSRG